MLAAGSGELEPICRGGAVAPLLLALHAEPQTAGRQVIRKGVLQLQISQCLDMQLQISRPVDTRGSSCGSALLSHTAAEVLSHTAATQVATV